MALLGELAVAVTANTLGFDEKIKRSRKEAAEFRKDLADTGRVLDSLKTPQDRYNDALKRLDDLHKKGMLTAEQHAAAQRKLSAEYDQTRNSVDDVNKSVDKSFGAKALQSVAAYAASLGTVATAAKVATELIKAMQEAGDRGSEAIKQREEVFARFAQVITPEGGAGDIKRMAKMAGDIQKQTGMSIGEAGSLVFDAVSTGFEGQLSEVGRTLPILQDARAVGLIAGKTRGLFKGDNLTPMQALSMTLEAAGQSPADFAELGASLPMAAEMAGATNTGAAETMATLAELAKVFGSTSTAAERIKAFSSKVAGDKELSQLGIVSAAMKIKEGGDEKITEVLGGSVEAQAAFSRIVEMAPTIRQTYERIETEGQRAAKGESILQAKVLAFEGTPEMMALRKAKVETMMAEGALVGEGERALLFEAAKQKSIRQMADSGDAAGLAAFGAGQGIIGDGTARAALRPQLDAAAERNREEASRKQDEANRILGEIAAGIKEQNRKGNEELPSL